ncbi:hypothetical protein BJ742DRAFT_203778 [Cladochytrium replicatum]|nr:hypothetical protein BJ742DRAFT_203778 [Cladochytrium replicatum]
MLRVRRTIRLALAPNGVLFTRGAFSQTLLSRSECSIPTGEVNEPTNFSTMEVVSSLSTIAANAVQLAVLSAFSGYYNFQKKTSGENRCAF